MSVGPLYPITWCKKRLAPTPCCWESYNNDQCVGIVAIKCDVGNSIGGGIGTMLPSDASCVLPASNWAEVIDLRSLIRVKTFGSEAANSHDCDNDIKLPRLVLVLGNVLPVTISGVVVVRCASAASFICRNSLLSAAINGFSRLNGCTDDDWSCDVVWPSASIVRYTVVNVCTQNRCNGIIKFGKLFSIQRQTKPTLNVSFVKKQDCVTDVTVRFIYKMRAKEKQRGQYKTILCVVSINLSRTSSISIEWERMIAINIFVCINLHVGKMCLPKVLCCPHPFCQLMQYNSRHRYGSKWATNRSIHLYWWALVLHRLRMTVVVGRQPSLLRHRSHSACTFSHNALESVHHLTHLSKFHIVDEMRSRQDIWF